MEQLQLAEVLPFTDVTDGRTGHPAAGGHVFVDVPLELTFPAVRHVMPCARVIMRNSLAPWGCEEKST